MTFNKQVVAVALENSQFTGDWYRFARNFVVGIKKITTCGKDTESCMAKVGILDFTLLFTLKAFTIIYMYDNVMYNKIVFGIILKGKLNTFNICMVLESSNCSVK